MGQLNAAFDPYGLDAALMSINIVSITRGKEIRVTPLQALCLSFSGLGVVRVTLYEIGKPL